MSVPFYTPLTTNPLGWAFLGAAGFVAYKMGKKSGLHAEESADVDTPSLGDRVVKGAMKTAYKAKKSAESSLAKAGEKYSAMWDEAKSEEA